MSGNLRSKKERGMFPGTGSQTAWVRARTAPLATAKQRSFNNIIISIFAYLHVQFKLVKFFRIRQRLQTITFPILGYFCSNLTIQSLRTWVSSWSSQICSHLLQYCSSWDILARFTDASLPVNAWYPDPGSQKGDPVTSQMTPLRAINKLESLTPLYFSSSAWVRFILMVSLTGTGSNLGSLLA